MSSPANRAAVADGLADDPPPGSQRRKPWLLPSNRKLRHLQGIVIRNLTINPQPSRSRGKTIDDDEIANNLQTPAKRLARRESRSMHHSRSVTDLQLAESQDVSKHPKDKEPQNGAEMGRLRRRSTLPWSGANPGARQDRLEDLVNSRMADTFFSLHCTGQDDPVYISEVVEKAMNPDFQFFDLNQCGPQVSRLDELTVKVWVKSAQTGRFILLLELQLNLKSLQFIGKALEHFHHPLPANCVLFQLTDGIYTNLTDLGPLESSLPPKLLEFQPPNSSALPTSSYDALMRLANLDDCIQDALATRDSLEAQINVILAKNREALDTSKRSSQAQENLAHVRRAISAEKKQVRQSLKRRDELLASLKARKEAMTRGRDAQAKSEAHLSDAQSNLASRANLLQQNTEEVMGQRRRICEDLLSVYPIEPIAARPLAFTIRNLWLPHSTFNDIDRETVAAALGYTAHVVYLLSFYLSVPLPYPIMPYQSTSFIQDHISVSLAQRTFPLYPVHVQYRFEYGVFLLNKDIEFLMNRLGLRVLDIRHTLPNLKYLLYVLTAGTGELPGRKAGGVRGLLTGRFMPGLSRHGSDASVRSSESFQPPRLADPSVRANGGVNKATDKGKARAEQTNMSQFVTSPVNRVIPVHIG